MAKIEDLEPGDEFKPEGSNKVYEVIEKAASVEGHGGEAVKMVVRPVEIHEAIFIRGTDVEVVA